MDAPWTTAYLRAAASERPACWNVHVRLRRNPFTAPRPNAPAAAGR